MADLTRRAWPNGWIPSDDSVNGRPTGLLRMDNLCLDENGALALTSGTQRIAGPFNGKIEAIYSKYFHNVKYRFVGTDGGDVLVQRGENTEFDGIIAGGSSTTCFTSALGCILISSGMVRVKFLARSAEEMEAGEPEQFWLGLGKPITPTVIGTIGQRSVVISSWGDGAVELITGTDLSYALPSVIFYSTSEFGVISFTPAAPRNLAIFDAGGASTPDDRFILEVRVGNTESLARLRIELLLDEEGNDYYWTDWSNEVLTESSFTQGVDALSQLEAKRKDFKRVGSNSELGWENVVKVRVSVVTTAITQIVLGTIYFFGSDAVLNGAYQYVVVNVHRLGKFAGRSGVSDPSAIVEVQNGNVRVTVYPANDAHVNEYWVYRRSAESGVDFRQLNEPAKLDTFYRVKVLTAPGEFTDTYPDEDALIDGITLDFRVASLNEINAEFMGMSEMVNGRIFYITVSDVYISSYNDPESYNPVHTIRLSGDIVDKNLWVTKAGINRILVGTTRDVYEIAGTFAELPDGSLDLSVRTLNVGFAPICRNFVNDQDRVYYMSGDGWRTVEGTIIQRLGDDLNLLYRGQTRYGMPPIKIFPNGLAIYACAVYKNQFWACMPLEDGTRRTFVYDLVRNYWHIRTIEPLSMWVEDDGIFVAGFGGGEGNYLTENYLRRLDYGSDYDGEFGQNILLQTIYDDNGQPRNRKDIFTLKLFGTTGLNDMNASVDVLLGRDDQPHEVVGSQPLYTTETFFDLSDTFGNQGGEAVEVLTLGKRFALRIVGTNLDEFKLWGFSIEYEPRPEMLNYLRILPTNMGSLTRKRWISYAFVIDTLGSDVNFTPTVDNVRGTRSVINTQNKLTYVHYFLTETVGTDVGGILWSTEDRVFEFYGLNLDETVSEKMPSPAKFLVIPANDYGIPNRKRHSSYKFQINTRGGNVRFTPKIDGVEYSPSIVTNSEKRTHEHFFYVDTIGIDIGGTLEALNDVPFEFYGVIVPQHIEVLPPRLKEFRIPENNYGIPAKKRVRTMPMEINTNGADVRFVPIVDRVAGTATIINTSVRSTAFHYFTTDSFGIDYSGELFSEEDTAFEFYGLLKPEEVEIIPVGKKYDQIGPVDFPRIGKLIAFRVRMISTGWDMPYTVYVEDTAVYTGSFGTTANIDKTYEVMQFPKTIWGTVFRIEFGPTSGGEVFHRYYCELKVILSGMQTEDKWLRVREPNDARGAVAR